MLTAGGPHMGTDTIPNCSAPGCSFINNIAAHLAYTPFIQSHCGPCGYYRDTKKWDDYMSESVFLPYLNGLKSYSADE